MKKVNEFLEKDSLKQPMLVKNLIKGVTQKGAPYASLVLQDATGTIDGKIWDLKPAQESLIKVGEVQLISCEVLRYNGALQLRVHSVESLDQTTVDLAQFVIASKVSNDELRAEINSTIHSIKNECYHAILVNLFEELGEKFYQYPAATRNHHSFLGGLATHVLGMIKLGEQICLLYPQLSRDLLLSGILVHDLGKVIELSGPIAPEYTIEGKLTGHISIMHGYVMEIAKNLGYEGREEVLLLRHCILSHHGEYEYGSPILPLVQEAEVLSFIDNLDARLNTLETVLNATEEGTFTQRVFAMENRSFYKPTTK